jgi:hypothetical protein
MVYRYLVSCLLLLSNLQEVFAQSRIRFPRIYPGKLYSGSNSDSSNWQNYLNAFIVAIVILIAVLSFFDRTSGTDSRDDVIENPIRTKREQVASIQPQNPRKDTMVRDSVIIIGLVLILIVSLFHF